MQKTFDPEKCKNSSDVLAMLNETSKGGVVTMHEVRWSDCVVIYDVASKKAADVEKAA